MIHRIYTFLFLLFGIGLITTGCNGQTPTIQVDSQQVQYVKRLSHSARNFEAKGDKESALNYHKQALQKSRSFGLPEQEAKALVGIARLLKKDDADKSLEYLRNALSIAQRLNSHELKADIYLAIAGVYKQQERYQEALIALEAHQKLLDTIFAKAKKLAVQHVKADEKSRLEHTVLIMVVIFFILSAIVAGFYFINKNALNKALRSSNQTKDKLFSIIGHDLRGPAGGIMEALDMVDAGILDEHEEKEVIALLKKQSKSYNETLNSLLKWASTQLNGPQTHQKKFDPKIIMMRVLEVLQGQASKKKLSLSVNVPDSLTILADPDHFEFIFRNLLGNAIKFSHEQGSIDITAKENENRVVISITDHGIGIPEEKQKHFLSSGSYMESTFGTSGEKGTGLGLVLCKEFILANKGKLWLESKQGVGTTFYMEMPKA